MSIDTEYLTVDEPVGYSTLEVVTLTGASYRQVDYWTRTRRIEPSLCAGSGSGSRRLYDKFDVALIRVVVWLITQDIPVTRAFDLAARLLAGGSHRVVLGEEFELVIRPIGKEST